MESNFVFTTENVCEKIAQIVEKGNCNCPEIIDVIRGRTEVELADPLMTKLRRQKLKDRLKYLKSADNNGGTAR